MSDPTRSRARDHASIHPVARSFAEWQGVLAGMGERPFRARQVYRWIHQRGVLDARAMTDLSKVLRERLAESGLEPPLTVADVHRSVDGTRKLLLDLRDGGRIECVLIPMTGEPDPAEEDAPSDERRRVTLCISTQLGCAMGCVFCASGQAGLVRGLGAAEIVSQVHLARGYLDPGEALTNLVFMGMGEPLHHYDETARALRLLSDPDGAGIGLRRITVSTVGLVPGIRRLGQDFGGKVGLAVSLHAPNDAVRGRIMPMNRRYSFDDVLRALRAYPLPQRRRITIEYTLIEGLNDAPEHARALADRLRGLRVKVNLIPMNAIEASELGAPDDAVVDRFRDVLTDAGYSCFVRRRRGDDVAAACGQLALADHLVRGRRKGASKGDGLGASNAGAD